MDPKKHSDFKSGDISDALARITSSVEFGKAYRLRQLLEHLVTRQLAGEEDDLRGYNIGLDVFEKGENFDPDTDTIVRVQMVRLRRMLEHYYLTHGKEEQIIIEIPKGRYVPAYRLGDSLDNEQHASKVADAANILWRTLKDWVVSKPYWFASGLAALVSFVWLSSSLLPTIEQSPQKTVMKRESYRLPRGPSIAVLPFSNGTGSKEYDLLIRGLPAHIIDSLTRFRELFVYAPDTTLGRRNEVEERLRTARKLGATYALLGGFSVVEQNLTVSAFLMTTDTGQVVWSKHFKRQLSGDNLHAIQTDIAASTAGQLGQPFGVIHRMESALNSRVKQQDFNAYQCILHFYEYATEETEKKHLEVRNCLEKNIEKTPNHAQSWAALSWIHVDEYRHGFNPKKDTSISALDRAFIAVRKAIMLDPEDAFIYRRLAIVMNLRGDMEASQKAIKKAVELNPNHADVLAHMGWNLKQSGQWEEAYLFARKAIRLNPSHPPWYMETPFWYFYRNQDCSNSYRTAKKHFLLVPEVAMREIMLILAGQLCKQKEIIENVKILNKGYRSFLTKPRKLLHDYGLPEPLLSVIIAKLQEAGVAVDSNPSKI